MVIQRPLVCINGQVQRLPTTDTLPAATSYVVIPVYFLPQITSSIGTLTVGQWANMPAALTELFGSTGYRTKFDLSGFAQIRLLAHVATAGRTGSKLSVQYSTDQTTWQYIDGSGAISSALIVGLQVSAWASIVAAAQADVFLRVVGIGGDGAINPVLGNITIQAR